jgi:hypothetical protein
MTYKFLYCMLILILLFEISKLFNYETNCSGFASSPTNYRLSNTEEDSLSDKFVDNNEELLLVTQPPNGVRKTEFSYIRAPLNTWIVVYVKTNRDGVVKQISNFPPIQIKSSNYKTLNLLGNNNFLLTDLSSTLTYYVKFLDDKALQAEINTVHQKNALRDKYLNCLKTNITLSKKQATDKCQTLLS